MSATPGVEIESLEAFLRAELPGLLSGPLRAELVAGGRSNLTYLVSDGVGRWVLRRPPLGHVLETAHDMGREHRLLSALHPTDVPVPRPLVLGGADVIGAPFYVMEFVDGAVLRSVDDLAGFDEGGAEALAYGLIDVLARLHRLDPASVGLGDLGRPAGYLERQLRRWARQLDASRSRELPELDRLHERLAARLPERQGAGIVHGDYRLDNTVVDARTGTVRAVLDWEMATLGDPLTDLASMVMWWDGIRGLDSPVAAVPGDLPAFPGGDHLVAEYGRLTGADLDELPWYLGFAHYKMAAIFEGIHYRSLQGMTVGEGFDRLGPMVPSLVERGHAALSDVNA
ncbi:phosphotransferase family protein [Cryptosporangium minutisporangium]|uniref:Phosphotransferase family protein n=1 Tax=Cryptosporangium minutisporangium TaxID=113569 RepID=A0ABP6SY70_9ACTN